jgi:2,3-bisphosphoglycerate-dependent phosphoglycerate mutase
MKNMNPPAPSVHLDWLLAGEPWIAYRARLDLLEKADNDPEVRLARRAMVADAPIQSLVGKQADWPGTPITRHKAAFYLLRHAESAPDRRLPESDWPLSSRGEAQARALIPLLEELGIKRIITSPYIRARHTVLPFSNQAGLEIEIDPDLRERWLAEGISDDWEMLIRRVWADLSFSAPGGESGLECQARVAASILRWIAAHPGETLLFSSHGNAIGLYLNLIDPTFGFDGWRAMRNPDLFCFNFKDGQVTWNRGFTFPNL